MDGAIKVQVFVELDNLDRYDRALILQPAYAELMQPAEEWRDLLKSIKSTVTE